MNVKHKLKMTKENYKKILDMWKNNENRDIKAVYHHSYISASELFDQAYSKILHYYLQQMIHHLSPLVLKLN